MAKNSTNIINLNLDKETIDLFKHGTIGFEKESLRVSNLQISNMPHPISIGSALCNSYITTDFAEAQLELVTPPFNNKEKARVFLNDLHHFVSKSIESEILWPFSIPPYFNSEDDIRIANYGSSNLGKFKRIYRNGLSHRYGKTMQTISGVHYNYSFSEQIWNDFANSDKKIFPFENKSEAYISMLRNIYRMNWLILYLFGCSPILTKNFIAKSNTSFKKLDDQTYYMPNATSLRMSEYGYSNSSRVKLNLSINSLDEYIAGLQSATNTSYSKFKNIKDSKGYKAQISPNILQIDDEYYAVARPKSNNLSNQQLSTKLKISGVDFIELRSLDLNPFSITGIDEEAIIFIELFLIFCFFKSSEPIDKEEYDLIANNDLMVSKKGREPKLILNKGSDRITLKDWSLEILDEIEITADILSLNTDSLNKIIDSMRMRVKHSELTLSEQLLEKILTEKTSFDELGYTIGKSNRDNYSNTSDKSNINLDQIKREVKNSIEKQKELEEIDKDYEDFLADYLS